MDKVTLAISLPINGTPWDRAAAICEAITAASMRGDTIGALALRQLYSDLRPLTIGTALTATAEYKFDHS